MKPTPDPAAGKRKDSEQSPPVVKLSAFCPNCGRANMPVFPAIWSANSKPDENPKLVCLACCPKVPDDS
jgi:hypothetical protein